MCQYFVLVTDWCFINVNQRTKCKEKITLNKVIALSITLSIHTVKTMLCSFTFDHFQIYFVAITCLNINVSRHSWKNESTVFFFISFVHLFYGMTNGIFVSLFDFVSLLMFLLYLMYIKQKCLYTGAFTN